MNRSRAHFHGIAPHGGAKSAEGMHHRMRPCLHYGGAKPSLLGRVLPVLETPPAAKGPACGKASGAKFRVERLSRGVDVLEPEWPDGTNKR